VLVSSRAWRRRLSAFRARLHLPVAEGRGYGLGRIDRVEADHRPALKGTGAVGRSRRSLAVAGVRHRSRGLGRRSSRCWT
jgi:hypothetical protein